MADIDLRIKAIDGLVLIHKAIKNVQLYPTSDLTIINAMESLYLHLMETLKQDYPSVFAELEKNILLGKNSSNQQADNTIHILSLLDIFRGLDIKNVSFDRDLEKEEIHILTNLLAKKPEYVPTEEANKNQETFSLLEIVEEPAPERTARYVDTKNNQGILTVLDIVEKPASDTPVETLEIKKDQEIVSAPEIVLEEPIPEPAAPVQEVKKEQEIISEPVIEQEEPVREPVIPVQEAKKEQEIIAAPESIAEKPVLEPVADAVQGKKGQEIISEPEIATEQISETAAGEEETGQDQESVFAPDIEEESISESIARMEKIFIRLNALDGAVSALPSKEQIDMIKKLSIRAAQWVEQNKDFSFEYKEICHRLQKLLQDFIDSGFFEEAIPIIDVFNRINNGTLIKDNLLREVSLEVLKNLASDNNIGILIKEINTNGSNKSIEARKIIAGFGDMVIKKLLNNLLSATDSKQRISVLHIIEEMGEAAIPSISFSIKVNSPWYYLRNVAYILGRIGNETSVDTLQPLLLHKDKRVRKEAFKSINQTGGNRRGEVLLSVLPQADQQLRVDIIETLGRIKYAEAVTDLQDMIKTKTSMPKEEQIAFHEKICAALGSIASPEAIKTLTEIAESKSILGLGSYPKEVKYAAQRALSNIRKR